MAINTVAMTGRLTCDPDMKYTQSGMPITTFRIAVDRGRKDEDGNMLSDFFNCVAFQKTAEMVAEYFDKGDPIGIEGRLQVDTWEKDGQKRSAVKVIANRVEGLESRAEREGAGGMKPAPQQRPAPQQAPGIDWTAEETEDPFGDQ